ncbi:TetR/AcrR family transcriptional regulator [Rhodovulum sp. DZ06]|uniref:TetR/AcrR family transcriptional regulator n=1 Tax=Rhodovulum sp. DZ06 TaxID=3425126 RepID=UPI003D33A533
MDQNVVTPPDPGDAPRSAPHAGVARRRILDAAELEFATHAFAGANMRRIADAAGVAPGLLHYHFGSKDGLFDAVLLRRAAAINDLRERALTALPDPDLEEILYAFFRPALDPAAGGSPYARILAGIAYGSQVHQQRVSDLYDSIAHLFIEAIRFAVPGLGRKEATRGYLLAVGALISVMARDGRSERLSGATEQDDLAEAIGNAVRFSAGGIRALAAGRRG